MNSFVKKQIDQISTEGWVALRPKLKRLVLFLPFELPSIILALLIVLFIRIISPLIIVRIGKIDVGRIGGIYQGEWYLTEKADGKHQGRYYDIFYFDKSTNHVNMQWKAMWMRALPFIPGSKFWQKMLRLNRLFPRYEKHEIAYQNVYPDLMTWQKHIKNPQSRKVEACNDRLISILKNAKPNISFNNKEIKDGQIVLENLGIPKSEQYICFHARDSEYLDSVLKTMDWSYHDYRDSSIQNYIPAAEEMANRGYYAVRMGAKVKDRIASSHPRVIDYATNGNRSDFNDIYIGSNSRFFLCSDGGMSSIPEMFRIPAVYVNWTNILRISSWVLNGLFIFKKFYLKNENRFMTFSEILNLDFGGWDRLNLELVESTPEEIQAVTIEMDERMNGTWENTEEDEELQQRFWSLFGPDKLKSPDLRIGAQYLRDNQVLLK